MCMEKWSDHGAGSGGFYKCNWYENAIKEKGSFQIEEEKWDKVRTDLEKFVFFFDWFSNQTRDIEFIKK